MNKVAITLSEGRIMDVVSDQNTEITIFKYDKVKKGMFKKESDLIAIEIHHVKGNKKAATGVFDEV